MTLSKALREIPIGAGMAGLLLASLLRRLWPPLADFIHSDADTEVSHVSVNFVLATRTQIHLASFQGASVEGGFSR